MAIPKQFRGLTVYRWLKTKLRACERRAEAYKGKTFKTAAAFALSHHHPDFSLDIHRTDLEWLNRRVFTNYPNYKTNAQVIAHAKLRFKAWQRSEAAKRSRRVSR